MKRDPPNELTPRRGNAQPKRQNQSTPPAHSLGATNPPPGTSSGANSPERSDATGQDPHIEKLVSILDELIGSQPESSSQAMSLKQLLQNSLRSQEEKNVANAMVGTYNAIHQIFPRIQIGETMVTVFSKYNSNQPSLPPNSQKSPPPPPPLPSISADNPLDAVSTINKELISSQSSNEAATLSPLQGMIIVSEIKDIQNKFREMIRLCKSQPNESKSTSKSRISSKDVNGAEVISNSKAVQPTSAADGAKAISNSEADTDVFKQVRLEQNEKELRVVNDDGEWRLGTLPENENNLKLVNEIGNKNALVKKIVDSWNAMLNGKINNRETYHERFEFLDRGIRNRGKVVVNNEEGKEKETNINEIQHTQPFIFGILRTFFRIYFQSKSYSRLYNDTIRDDNDKSGFEKDYLLNASLFLYTERKAAENDATKATGGNGSNEISTFSNVGRRPDAAFFQRGTPVDNNDKDSDEVKYDSAVREGGLLVSVEAKRYLNTKNMNDALFECQRDFAHVAGKFASSQNRVGFSIITDGVRWYFLCISWQLIRNASGNKWKHCIRQSKPINFKANGENTELAEWLLFVLNLSLTQPQLSSGKIFAKTTVGGATLTRIYHAGGRSCVSLWQKNANKRFVLKKFEHGLDPDDADKNLIYMTREMKMLQELASYENIVNLVQDRPTFVRGLWLEYGGTPVEGMDICGKRGRQLARIVKGDIWVKALGALNAKSICHGDIHETNILVCLKRNKATLIDFESAKTYGTSLEGSPIRHRLKDHYKTAMEEVDRIAVAAILKFLWEDKRTHFGSKLLVELENLKRKIDEEDENRKRTSQKVTDQQICIASWETVLNPIVKQIPN